MSDNATILRLEKINSVYVQTIREQDARIAALEAQLAAAEAELAEIDNALWASMGDEKYDRAKRVNFLLREGSLKHQAEQQLAAAQERERIFRAEADYYLAYIYRGIFEDERERGEFEDDAIRIANNIMASLKQSALAEAQKENER